MILDPLLPWPLVLAGLLVVLALLGAGAARAGRRERSAWWWRAGMAFTLAAVLLRPGVGEVEVPRRSADLDVVVVLDRTASMGVADGHGGQSRFATAREDLVRLTDALPGSRFALLTWGRTPRVELPLSSDARAFATVLETARPESAFDGSGSDVTRPLEELEGLLARAEEQQPERRRVVVWVGDGEVTADGASPVDAYADVAGLLAGGVVLGYGTPQGGPVPVDSLEPGAGFVNDRTGEEVVSRLDEDGLQALAVALGVGYRRADDPDVVTAWAEQVEQRLVEAEEGAAEVLAAHDLGWVLGLLLVGLALADLRTSSRTWRETRADAGLGTAPAVGRGVRP